MKLNVLGSILKKDKKAVAIVGSRLMSEYGKKQAYYFSSTLAKNGITIVSGLARGIDTVAHMAALDVGGRTIAVLGSGIQNIYPPENKMLAQSIAKNGAVVSQFSKNMPPLGKNFLIRNKLIVELSRAVLVIEGKRRSGTISTATYAANVGREVFAIPGQIDSELSQAPLYLIENGAQIAHSPSGIIEYIESIC